MIARDSTFQIHDLLKKYNIFLLQIIDVKLNLGKRLLRYPYESLDFVSKSYQAKW